MDDNKGLLVLGVIGVGVWLLLKNKPEGDVTKAASVSLSIQRVGGGIGGISAEVGDDLIAGSSYVLSTSIGNQSTLGGVPCPAVFSIQWGGSLVNTSQSASFAAGESKSFSSPFTIPTGMAGSTATFTVSVRAPNGVIVANDTIQAYVVAQTPIYAANANLSY